MLKAQDQVGRDGSNQAEDYEGDSVLFPSHFFGRINAGHPEDESLNRSKKKIEPPIRILGVRLLRLLVFGLSAVLAEIRIPENRELDTHNLGKTTIGALIDDAQLA